MKFIGQDMKKNGTDVETVTGAQVKADTAETNAKAAIPTKLSELQNDIGAGEGLTIVPSLSEPATIVTGDWWYDTEIEVEPGEGLYIVSSATEPTALLAGNWWYETL